METGREVAISYTISKDVARWTGSPAHRCVGRSSSSAARFPPSPGPSPQQPDKAIPGQIERGGETTGPRTGGYVLRAYFSLDQSREYGFGRDLRLAVRR